MGVVGYVSGINATSADVDRCWCRQQHHYASKRHQVRVVLCAPQTTSCVLTFSAAENVEGYFCHILLIG